MFRWFLYSLNTKVSGFTFMLVGSREISISIRTSVDIVRFPILAVSLNYIYCRNRTSVETTDIDAYAARV